MSLRSLLCSPEPSDPQDAEVAKHYLSDKKGFEETAKYWCKIYADGSQSARPPKASENSSRGSKGKTSAAGGSGKNGEEDEALLAGLKVEHVNQFVGMGFDRKQVIDVLKKLNYRGAK